MSAEVSHFPPLSKVLTTTVHYVSILWVVSLYYIGSGSSSLSFSSYMSTYGTPYTCVVSPMLPVVILALLVSATVLLVPRNSSSTNAGTGIIFLSLPRVSLPPGLSGFYPFLQLNLSIMPSPQFSNQKVPYYCWVDLVIFHTALFLIFLHQSFNFVLIQSGAIMGVILLLFSTIPEFRKNDFLSPCSFTVCKSTMCCLLCLVCHVKPHMNQATLYSDFES